MEQFTNNTTKTMPYRVVVADPPWPKNQKGARGAQKHYNLMSMKEILNLPRVRVLALGHKFYDE